MRIALVHLRHAESGGTERYLNLLAAWLAERGHEVEIVCRRHAAPPHPGVRFRVLHGFALGGGWRQWRFARDVELLCARERYDLVYGLGKTWTHDVIRLGGGCQETYLERAHEAARGPLGRLVGKGLVKHRLAVAIERRALAPGAYRRVVTNSEMVRRDVVARHGVPPELVTTIYNGVDLERFHPRRRGGPGARLRAELGLGPEERVLLFLGTGYGRKGLDLVLEAFPRVAAARPRTRLLVVGRDGSPGRWRARAEALGIGERTRFLGGRRDAENCFAAADLYVLPTRYDPFANTTLEAMASGLPVVTSTTNGGAELVDEGAQGSLVEVARGPEPLAAALTSWLDDERLAAGRRAARARAEEHGAPSKLAATERLLREVAAVPRAERPLGRARTRA